MPAKRRAASGNKGKAAEMPSPATVFRRQSRGRGATAKKEEAPAAVPKTTSRSRGSVTRAVVQEVEDKKPEPKGRSTSRSSKASTPAPATPKGRTATPKQKAETPKGKAVTPKQKVETPKQKSTSRQRTATPKKQETPQSKGSTKKSPTVAKGTPTTAKRSPTPKKKEAAPKKSETKKVTPKAEPPRSTSRSRRVKLEEEKIDESEKKEDTEMEGEEKVVAEETEAANTDTQGKDASVKEACATDESIDDDVKDEEEESGEDKSAESESKEADDEDAKVVPEQDKVEEKEPEEESVEEEVTKPVDEKTDDVAEEKEMEVDAQEDVSADEDKADEISEKEAPVVIAEDKLESNKPETAIAINDDNDDDSNDDEVELVLQEVTDEEDEVEDNVEIISDTSSTDARDAIDINEDSGEAVVVGEDQSGSNDVEVIGDGPGRVDEKEKVNSTVEEISDDENDADDVEEIGFTQNQDKGVSNGAPEKNGEGEDDGNSKKRKIDEVIDIDNGVSEMKKAKVASEDLNVNNGADDVDDDVAKDYVVIEMEDVPVANSEEVKQSVPPVFDTSVFDKINPVLNRTFVPNPGYVPTDPSKQFSIASYNMLADCHLFRNDYSFTEAQFLAPEYRLKTVIEELKYLDSDIVCMQEVAPDYYNGQLAPALKSIGYEGLFKQRTDDYFDEGEATFYRTSRFTLVEQSLHRLADLVDKVLVEGIDPTIQAAVCKYMDLPDVCVIAKLECKATKQNITVGNVHINWGEMKAPDAQCVQVASAVKEIVSKCGGDSFPHIICGDFNSPPLSPGYLVARDGYPSGDETINRLMQIEGLEMPDGKKASLVNSLWPAFQHTSSSLKSAYLEAQGSEPEITSYNRVMCECVDYIFYSSASLDNVGVLQVAPRASIVATGGTPNKWFPSDHVSIKATLAFNAS
ncbi:CCR4-like protein [Mya arenaria]|uniref:CCR4-like protein n=1 Tax=Mya arenaria TaxID=6604 RepID=A0ABY7EIH5_MYAAR|nr:CCR4-like protein [Mya arenaria]